MAGIKKLDGYAVGTLTTLKASFCRASSLSLKDWYVPWRETRKTKQTITKRGNLPTSKRRENNPGNNFFFSHLKGGNVRDSKPNRLPGLMPLNDIPTAANKSTL